MKTTYFLFYILFYFHNHSLLSYFSFSFLFLNHLWKNSHFNYVFNPKRLNFVICNYSIMLICCYFTGCISHLWSLYSTKYLFLFIYKEPLGDLLQNDCSTSVLNLDMSVKVFHFCLSCKLQTCKFTKIELLQQDLSNIWTIQSAWYSVEQLFWRISIFRISSLKVFCNFRKIHRKTNVSESLFKSTCSSKPPTLLKRNSDADVFLWVWWNFKEHRFYRTPPKVCFCISGEHLLQRMLPVQLLNFAKETGE